MKNNSSRFILEEHNNDFQYKKNKQGIEVKFNRVAFIFFIFFIIALIYTIHLLHLGSRKLNVESINQPKIINKLHRADIIDRNGNFLAKTVSSIDIGINPIEIIDQKKILLNLGYIFPNKNYELVKNNISKKNFFGLKKKYQKKIMKKL